MLSPVVRCMFALMESAFVSTTSNVSLSKGCLLSFPSVLTKLYLTSISKVGSRLYTRKNGEKFVEVCLLTLSANKTPSIILNQSHGLPSKTLIFFFWYTYSFVPIWLRMIHRSYSCSVPIILCETLLTSYTNCFPWFLIWIFIHWGHIISYSWRNWAMVEALLSLWVLSQTIYYNILRRRLNPWNHQLQEGYICRYQFVALHQF